jgi:phage host-nuclease inhibitor protein Gam
MARTKIELNAWKRLVAVRTEEAALIRSAAPIREKMEEQCRIRNEANDVANKLGEEYNAVLFPKMRELRAEIAMLSKMLSGKKPPTEDELKEAESQ